MQHDPNRHGAAVVRYEGKRGVVWRIKYRDATGEQVMETVGAERDGITERKAEAELRERLVRVERRGYRRPKRLTFGAYADTWLEEGERRRGWAPGTVTCYRNVVGHLKDELGPMTLGGIRPRDVAAYTRTALDNEFAPATVVLHLNLLFDIFKTARVEELIETNPAEGAERPKVPRRRWRILQPTEFAPVLNAFIDEQAKTMFLVLMLTGVRQHELRGLRWRDVSLVENILRVAKSKTDEGERSIALSAALVDALAGQYTRSRYKADSDYVFCDPERGTRISDRWFAEEFRAALSTAGITDYVRPFHDLRHSSLTNGAAAGEQPIALMARAGHRSMSTTKQYLHLAGVVFRQEADALEARMMGRSFYPTEQTSDDLTAPEATEQAGS
jgi:integrase